MYCDRLLPIPPMSPTMMCVRLGLAEKRRGTEVAENPGLLRPQRKVGHAAAGRKTGRHAAPPGANAA